MRRRWNITALAAGVAVAYATVAEPHPSSSVDVSSMAQLQEQLADMADALLVKRHIRLDRDSARLVTSRPVSSGERLRVEALWEAQRMPSQLPMQFAMHPVDTQGDAAPVRAVLSAVLVTDAWVTSRILRKGSPIGCADLKLEPRKLTSLPKGALGRECGIADGSVAQRDLGSREMVRDTDAGPAPSVSAHAPVTLSVVQGLITIDTRAVALSDAREGETLQVRLVNPRRVVQARVDGPGRVSLLESP